MTKRVAILVPGLVTSGGVQTVAEFLYKTIEYSGKYEPHLYSIPLSSKDKSSIRITSPHTWFRGAVVEKGCWNGRPYQHFGAVGAELEFQRYQPRRKLTQILSDYDLVQVVSGSPAWAYVTKDLSQPICLQVATLAVVERQALFQKLSGSRRLWMKATSHVTNKLDFAALEHLSAVFVENQWMYKLLLTKMPPERVIFAPPGVNTHQFSPGQYKEKGHILAVGRLGDYRKNVPILYRAYHRLRQILPNAPKLVLAGKTMPDASVLQLAKNLHIEKHIEMIENIPTSELAELYRQASLFVLSSDEEGLGIVLLEAMASGIPVVATRCGGPETAVLDKKTGYLVPKGNAEALAQRMGKILSDTTLAESMGMAGRQRVEKEFSYTAAARKFLDQYDILLSQ